MLRVKNIQAGFRDAQGRFHPIRYSDDYEPGRAGETPREEDRDWKKHKKEMLAQIARDIYERYGKRIGPLRGATKEAMAASKKRAAKKKAAAKKKSAAKRARTKKNPLPVNRYVPARVKRTPKGDIKIMIPL